MSIQQPIVGIDQVHDFKKENRLATENILAILLNIAENVSPLSSAASSQGGAGEDSETPETPMTVDLSQIQADETPSSSPVTTSNRATQAMTPQPDKYGNTGKKRKSSFSERSTLSEVRKEEAEIMEDDSTNPSANVLEDFNASLFVIFIDYLFSIDFWNFEIPNEAEILKMIPVNLLSYEKLLYLEFLTFFYKNLEDKNLNLVDNLSKFIEESSFKDFSKSIYDELILSKGIPSVEDGIPNIEVDDKSMDIDSGTKRPAEDDASIDLDGGMKRPAESIGLRQTDDNLPPIKRKQFRSFRRPVSMDEPSPEDTEMATEPVAETASEELPMNTVDQSTEMVTEGVPAHVDTEMDTEGVNTDAVAVQGPPDTSLPIADVVHSSDTESEAGPSGVTQLDNNELEASLIQWIKDVNSFNPLTNFDEKVKKFPDQVLDYLLEKFNEIIHTTKGKHANKKKILKINYNLMKLAFLQDDISKTYAEDITKTEQDNEDSNIISGLKNLIDKKSDKDIPILKWPSFPGGPRVTSKTTNLETKEICKVITNEKTRDLFNIKSIYPGSQYFPQWQAIGNKKIVKPNVVDNEEIAKPEIEKQIKTNPNIIHSFTQPMDVPYFEYGGVFWDCTQNGNVISVDCAKWVPPGNTGDDAIWLLKFIYFNQISFEKLENKYVKLLYFISILESIFNKFNTDIQSNKSKLDNKIKKNINTIKKTIRDFKKLLNDFLEAYNKLNVENISNICIFDFGKEKSEFSEFLKLIESINNIEVKTDFKEIYKIADTIDGFFLTSSKKSFTWPEKEGLACEQLIKCMMTNLNEKLSNNSGVPMDSYSEALNLIKETLGEVIDGKNIKEIEFREKFLKIPNLFNKTTYQKASKPIGEDTEKILTFLTKDTQIPQDAIGEVNESIIAGNKNEFIRKKTHFFINNAVQGSGVWPWPAFRICSIGSILDSAGPQVHCLIN
jgi:hypothetical protein